MDRSILDYHRSERSECRFPLFGQICLIAVHLLLVTSIVCCFLTWKSPGRFIFVPAGDVGLGFRSYAGWLEWVEYAPWDPRPDSVEISVSWMQTIAIEALAVVLVYLRRRQWK